MTTSLFSENWHRVAHLKPKLRDNVIVKRQHWRKQLWYLLTEKMTGHQHRINTAAYQFIGRCNGTLTVQQVWDTLLLHQKDDAPTQDEVIELLARVNQQELVQYKDIADTAGLFKRRNNRVSQKRQSYLNPFSIKMALGNPAPWLNKLDHIAQFIFQPMTLLICLSLILFAMLIAGSEWSAITAQASQHMLTPRYLTLSIICFPLIKAIHELSHGLAVRRWGGEVHEFGISLLVFVPAPYVNASAANAFPLRHQRIVVSAAGILTEMSIASIALILWLNVQPGLIKDLAFVTMFIGSVSTLLFNGNPLLRFDGYYVLSDFLDIPNLSTRSNQYWSEKFRSLMTTTSISSQEIVRGEKIWLILYAPLSFAYRLIISFIIILWLGEKWLLLGVLATLYMIFTLLLRPVFKGASQLMAKSTPGEELNRVRRNITLAGMSVFILFLIVPLPFSTVAPAVAWLPEKAQIRPQEDGFIKALPVINGQLVKAGDLLATIENPKLNKKKMNLLSKLDGLRTDQFQLLISNPAKAQNITQEIISAERELAYIEKKISGLTIKAQVDGELVMPKQKDIINTYIHRGENVGYIFEETPIKVRAVVAGKDAYFVRNMTNNVNVWLVESPREKYQVQMTLDMPSATRILPSASMGDKAGGTYVTDPSDKHGTKVLEPVFLFDLTLLDSSMQRVGGTAYVRFEHDAMPLAEQLYRRANQLFLKSFKSSI
ncbi:MAG: putative peptide zinc metalloprotease protein [Methylophilaceae bacterium]|jgi:putative peptide zinc metalloprotease protein